MANPHGSFIWYELITPDVDAAKAFYDAVVGWDVDDSNRIPQRLSDDRSVDDGKFAGGILPLTEEMRGHGARPVWLGYIEVDDVDATVAKRSRPMAAQVDDAAHSTFPASAAWPWSPTRRARHST